jgi:hypothetical protein
VAGAGDATQRTIRRTLAHSSISIEFTFQSTADNGSPNLTVEFLSDGSANYYRAYFSATAASLYKIIGGSATEVATVGSFAHPIISGNGHPYRVQISAIGGAITGKIDGEVQISYTDGSPIASGTSFAILATGFAGQVRSLSARTTNTVTLTGLTPGTSATVMGYCGFAAGLVAANDSGVATFTANHFPMQSIRVGGIDYTPAGGIWGGDTLAFSGFPAALPPSNLGFGGL